ncbi:hypothetical protein DMH15_18085 [Streptomyces sp. WAC 06725]|uniref:hypothetical protein n=1 Tax=Streptomyces sp. WAC 06725 TaxID=2203209 RepID=UPI000F740942|nr:hypothetical protein [Streptomyces sp. WAC 06725]RSO37815.1 hypothetical protein DMH15_18085 [Streptomyces sp. WAC 06725]
MIAIVPATGACALAGTDAPFLVNARGPAKGPAPAAARIGAGVPCLLFLAGIGVFVRKVMLRGLAPPVRRRRRPRCVADPRPVRATGPELGRDRGGGRAW